MACTSIRTDEWHIITIHVKWKNDALKGLEYGRKVYSKQTT